MSRRGTITKYDDDQGRTRWRFRVDLAGGRGERRQAKRQGFKTRTAAADAMKILLAHHQGVTVRTDDTLAEYLERWAGQRRDVDQIRASTAASYLAKIRYVKDRRPELRLTDVRPADLTGLYVEMRRDGLGPRTVRYLHTIIRKALADATGQGLLGTNPADAAMPPSAKAAAAAERTIWTAEEGRAFLAWDRLPDNRRACWLLILNAGLRRGELAGLEWGDIDGDTIRIDRTRSMINGELVETPPKSDRSRRTVVLSPDTVVAVKSWKIRQAEKYLRVGLGGGASHYATNAKLRPFPPDDLSHRWKADADAAVEANVVSSYMSLHDGRHWHATQLVANGTDMRTIADRLGHADPGFTLRTYGHSDLDRQRSAVAKLDAAVL